MSSQRDIKLLKQKYEAGFADFRHVTEAELIRVDGNVEVPNKPSFMWARTLTEPANVFMVFNIESQPRNGLPVLVGQDPRTPYMWQVLQVDASKVYNLQQYAGSPFLPNHHRDHEWPDFKPGPDAVSVYPRSPVALRTYAGTVAMTISVVSYRYKSGTNLVEFGGLLDEDLSDHQPAVGRARWVVVGLNINTNLIELVIGETAIDTSVVIPPFPNITNDLELSAAIRLDGSQTTITEADILDFRIPYSIAVAHSDLTKQLAWVEGEFDIMLTKHIVEG